MTSASNGSKAYAIGIERPPPMEKRAGSYLARIDEHSGMEVTYRDRLMAANSVTMLGNDISLLGYFPYEKRSTAVWRSLRSDGGIKWQHIEESERWDFPATIIEHKDSYLAISLSHSFEYAPISATLRISKLSKSGEVLEKRDFATSIDGVVSNKSVILTSDGNILIAIGGTQWVSADTKDSVWVNPNTGSRKLCSPEDLTELISIDPDSLEVLQRSVVKDINVSAMAQDRGTVYAVGASHVNCRIETNLKMVEITPSLDLKIKLESRNVNSVDLRDIKALGNGVFLLGGRVNVFLPTVLANKVLSKEELNKSLVSNVSNVWAEAFWDSGEKHFAALLMAVTADGEVLADRVFPDLRGRSFTALLVRPPEQVLGVGSAFGDRGWAAWMRLGERVSKFRSAPEGLPPAKE